MTEQGTVTEIKGNKAVVEIKRSAACRGCRACYRSGNDKMFIEVENRVGAEVGDKVSLDVNSKSLLIAFSTVFMIPLFFLISGFFLGNFLANLTDVGISPQSFGFVMSLVFLGLSYLLIKKIDEKMALNNQFEPYITHIWKEN